MSTKIYNGYIFTDYPSLYALRLRMERLRRKVQKEISKQLLLLTASKCVNLIDKIALGEYVGNKKSTILHEVKSEIEDRYKKIEEKRMRDPDYDFYFTLQILPIRGKILAMAFCERKILEKLDGISWLKPYPYWNSTEKPDNISDKEWEQRRIDWDKALGENSIPSQNGFKVEFTLPYLYYPYFPCAEKLLKLIPSFDDRLEKITRRKVIDLIVKKFVEENNGEFRGSFVFNAIDCLEKPEYEELIHKTKSEIFEKIPKEITEEMLLQEITIKEDEEPKGEENDSLWD